VTDITGSALPAQRRFASLAPKLPHGNGIWLMAELGQVRIGTSGYVYPHWRKGTFYPAGHPTKLELAYYAGRFRTVELNNPFYRLPTPEMFVRWRESTPENFDFAVKASRYITHIKRLHDVSDAVDLFLQRALLLESKLGPILFQLPPNQQIDLPRLRTFLSLLSPERRWVIEFRHPSWHAGEVYQLLAEYGAALCIPVGGGMHPDRITTAAFTYIRMHRGQEPDGGFSVEELKAWAGQVRALESSGKDVYVYFNNDWGGLAIRDALRLEEMLWSSSVRA
jgi:uncharacterized protein YecE (DUF72 family)